MAQSRNLGAGLGVLGGFTLLVFGSLSFTFIDQIIRSQIIKKVLLVNGTEAYTLWQDAPIPIYLQVWVWDLENAGEVSAGGVPNVTQRGPYTYREHRRKVDVTYNPNGTVSYRQIKTYHFVRNMSVGWDNDTFTTVNIPYMTLVNGFSSKSASLQWIISHALKFVFRNEDVFLRRSVREIVWGYTDPILHFAKKWDKKTFTQDFVGVLSGKNATDDGLYTVFTGENNITLLGVIDKYNGEKLLNYWTSVQANMVNGTDGSVAPPFLDKSRIVRMFTTDICRSVYGTYHGMVKTLEDITLYRFTAPKAAMAAPPHNPANAGFCTPAGNCLGDGVLNISVCQIIDTFHLPIVASSPHFYMADPKYAKAMPNMHPDPEQHSTNIDIEPNTGFVMQVNKRLQINVYLKPDVHFDKTAKLKTLVFPVLWLNESAATDEAHARQLKNELLIPKAALGVVKYVLVLLGVVIVLVGVSAVVLLSLRNQPQKEESLTESDNRYDEVYTEENVSSGILRAPSTDPLIIS